MTTIITITESLRSPRLAAARLIDCGAIYGLKDVTVLGSDSQAAVFELVLDPWAAMAAEGYPQEVIAVLVHREGEAYASPHSDTGRHWKHRYPMEVLRPCKPRHLGQLCLWYPWDPRERRWHKEDGLETFITMAHRHLMAEEYWRRSGFREWPAPDAPHGGPPKP
jgi:hypothetical protein